MYDTWYEINSAKKESMPETEYFDYRSNDGEHKLYAVCTCKGRIKEGDPLCARNPDKELAHRGQGWCLFFLPNGSAHCGHRFPPKEKEE